MNDINKKILTLINKNYSMKTIAKELNISQKQLYVRIKWLINYGYNIKSSYYYNSDIYYEFDDKQEVDEITKIHFYQVPNEIRFLAISDTHIGNQYSNIDLIKRVYEYASNNNIKLIFNCGDLIEGSYTGSLKHIEVLSDQIEFFLNKHPYDKNINNFVILGNHDLRSLKVDGLDVAKTISNYRYDIVPIGYGKGIVNFENNLIGLYHKLSSSDYKKIPDKCKLILSGHGHMMKTKAYEKYQICVPTLSYHFPDAHKDILPGFIDMSISLDSGKFEFVVVKHFVVTPKIIQASESRCRIKTIYK